jgi:hypothetical protein
VRIGARHDDELRIGAPVDRGLDAIGHLRRGHQRLARPVAAALGRHLILEMHAGGAGADELTRGAGDVEGGAPAGVGIDQQRQLAGAADAAHILADVISAVIPKSGRPKEALATPAPDR